MATVSASPHQGEARLHTIVEHIPDLVFSLDEGGRFQFANARAEEFLGGPREDVIGQRLQDFVDQDHLAEAETLFRSQPGEVWDREIVIRARNGTSRWVRIRCTHCQDPAGGPSFYEGVMRDRTAQRAMEEQIESYHRSLVQSEQRYRNLVESLPDTIFSLDSEGRFTYVNQQIGHLLGYSSSQLLRKPLLDFVAAEYLKEAQELLSDGSRTVRDAELELVHADGDERWVRIRCTATLGNDGSAKSFEGIIRDRTEKRKLERELKASREQLMQKIKVIDELYEHIVQSQKSRAIAQHTAEVAHELRQPLAIIGGFARRMASQAAICSQLDEDRQRECFGIIVREVQRLEDILSNLIDFNRQVALRLEEVEPNAVIQDVVRVNEGRLAEKNLTLDLDLGREAGEILLDPDRFQHVVRNLITNAIEASPEHGTIRVETGVAIPSSQAQRTGSLASETYFEIKVHNTGRVIPPEELDKVFDPFFTTKEHGTGLGLALTKRIIEEHDGSISVRSDESGTVFTVWIPVQPMGKVEEGEEKKASSMEEDRSRVTAGVDKESFLLNWLRERRSPPEGHEDDEL